MSGFKPLMINYSITQHLLLSTQCMVAELHMELSLKKTVLWGHFSDTNPAYVSIVLNKNMDRTTGRLTLLSIRYSQS